MPDSILVIIPESPQTASQTLLLALNLGCTPVDMMLYRCSFNF